MRRDPDTLSHCHMGHPWPNDASDDDPVDAVDSAARVQVHFQELADVAEQKEEVKE